MTTKLDELRVFVANKQYNKALRITSKFFTVLTVEQKRIFQIAHEVVNCNRAVFYKGLGINTDEIVTKSTKLLIELYGK